MSVPFSCLQCGKIVGALSSRPADYDLIISAIKQKDGTCSHAEPKRTEATGLFGLIRRIRIEYPETETSDSWEAYAGPSNKFLLWIAIVLGTRRSPSGSYDGIIVNGKWAWWDPKIGFYGDGVSELANLRKSV